MRARRTRSKRSATRPCRSRSSASCVPRTRASRSNAPSAPMSAGALPGRPAGQRSSPSWSSRRAMRRRCARTRSASTSRRSTGAASSTRRSIDPPSRRCSPSPRSLPTGSPLDPGLSEFQQRKKCEWQAIVYGIRTCFWEEADDIVSRPLSHQKLHALGRISRWSMLAEPGMSPVREAACRAEKKDAAAPL